MQGDALAARQALLAAAWLHGRAADDQLACAPSSLAHRAGELTEAMRTVAAARGRSPRAA
jgi:hypothetical protein